MTIVGVELSANGTAVSPDSLPEVKPDELDEKLKEAKTKNNYTVVPDVETKVVS